MKRSTMSVAVVLTALLVVGGGISWRAARAVTSGVPVASKLLSFRPYHISGADKGTMVCPVCEYSTNPAVQVWVNGDDEKNIAAIAMVLEKAMIAQSQKKFKAFVVYANVEHKPEAPICAELKEMAARYNLKNVALTVMRNSDHNAVEDYQINPDPRVRNTVFVYRALKVNTKFVNLVADEKGLASFERAIDAVLQ